MTVLTAVTVSGPYKICIKYWLDERMVEGMGERAVQMVFDR